jgi:NAD(P)-dependent dehydrogenase (short-subunit alcohol dehydrogenase family)
VLIEDGGSPGLNVLINNSGSNWAAPYATYPSSAWDRVLTLNLKRVFQLTQLLTPLLITASTPDNPSRIINIGSIDALRVPALETFAYSASKAGLHHTSRVLASHLGGKGVTSNVVACGPFASKMMAKTLEERGKEVAAGVPMGRIGSKEDVAGTCIWLSGRAGAWVNGATIALDGGSVVSAKL